MAERCVLFFPYKLDISLYRVPFLTVLVCLICTMTFLSQGTSANKFGQNLRGAAIGAVLGLSYRLFTPRRLDELEMAMGA